MLLLLFLLPSTLIAAATTLRVCIYRTFGQDFFEAWLSSQIKHFTTTRRTYISVLGSTNAREGGQRLMSLLWYLWCFFYRRTCVITFSIQTVSVKSLARLSGRCFVVTRSIWIFYRYCMRNICKSEALLRIVFEFYRIGTLFSLQLKTHSFILCQFCVIEFNGFYRSFTTTSLLTIPSSPVPCEGQSSPLTGLPSWVALCRRWYDDDDDGPLTICYRCGPPIPISMSHGHIFFSEDPDCPGGHMTPHASLSRRVWPRWLVDWEWQIWWKLARIGCTQWKNALIQGQVKEIPCRVGWNLR